MNKKEVTEIKKTYTKENTSISRICGCYVSADGEKISTFGQTFLVLPEEEQYKYFDIFKKVLSGGLEKNLLNIEYETRSEQSGGSQQKMLKLRDSMLKDENQLDEFYDRVIGSYEAESNYLILLIADAYDVMKKTSDGDELDESEEVYQYILCAICPVKLSAPGLSYAEESDEFHERQRDWIVQKPEYGFVYPAFNDRSADIHAALFYAKSSKKLPESLINELFGVSGVLSAEEQKDAFLKTLDDTIRPDYETAKNIYTNIIEKTNDLLEDGKPPVLTQEDICDAVEKSGTDQDSLQAFRRELASRAGKDVPVAAGNIVNNKACEIKTSSMSVKADVDQMEELEIQEVDGRKCIVIPVDKVLSVDGMKLGN